MSMWHANLATLGSGSARGLGIEENGAAGSLATHRPTKEKTPDKGS